MPHEDVKGVQGSRPEFLITQRKVDAAEWDPAWEVWIVTAALSAKRRATKMPGTGFLVSYGVPCELRPRTGHAASPSPAVRSGPGTGW